MDVDALLMSGFSCVPEPNLQFSPENPQDVSKHPLEGLLSYGPYSASILKGAWNSVRVASISPYSSATRIRSLVEELQQSHKPNERRNYLPIFPGFFQVFQIGISLAGDEVNIELSKELDEKLATSNQAHLTLAQSLTDSINAIQSFRNEFDVLLIYLPSRWEAGFQGSPDEDFDLHDYLKSVTAKLGIPSQIVRDDSALNYSCRCSVMWRLGIALYAKAGGIPWKLEELEEDVAHVGISYALRSPERSKDLFVTCTSQIFDSDGGGIEFIAYETKGIEVIRDNPFLNRSEMMRLMARTLGLYQKRHGGRSPKRIYVHKSTQFKPQEIDGCFDALRSVEVIDLVQVQRDSPWRGILIESPKRPNTQKGSPSGYPVERGTYLPLSGTEVLLWTQGNAPSAVEGRNFYKEGKGIPSPLLLKRFAGHGGWEDTCRTILGLTKMDWNNDALYNQLPVTMSYAQLLARTIKRIQILSDQPYQFRFFM